MLFKAPHDVARKLWLAHALRPPIDVDSFCAQLGVHVHRVAIPGDLQGALRHLNGSWAITVNTANKRPETSCRFIIAHELGHLLLGHCQAQPGFRDTGEETSFMERHANDFARELLVPAHVLSRIVPHRSFGQLAALFGVSYSVLHIQLERHGLVEAVGSRQRSPASNGRIINVWTA